jgi:hypothetical protein
MAPDCLESYTPTPQSSGRTATPFGAATARNTGVETNKSFENVVIGFDVPEAAE